MTFQLTGKETALIPSVLVVLIRAATLHAITSVIIKTCTRTLPYCRGMSESASACAVTLMLNDGRHGDTEAVSSQLTKISWFVAAPNPNLHLLISHVGNTQQREAEPQKTWSLIHESVCWNGSAQRRRQIITDQNKYLTNWMKKKKRQEDKTRHWAAAPGLNFNHP